MDALAILIPVVLYALGILVMYFVIQTAIVNGMRRARREQFTEDFAPEKASWLTERQRQQLRAHADANGKGMPN